MNQEAVFLFPGQGSQFIGMGLNLAHEFPIAKETFDEVDEALHQPLSQLMFTGNLDLLTQTQNAQPAIMAVSIAIWRILTTQSDIHPVAMAGHSLGEYSALCASGCITLSQTAQLLKARGEAMASAAHHQSGGMLAVLGANYEQIQEILAKTNCTIANDNCPGQVVLSGSLANISTAKMLAEQIGIKRTVPLAVSGAFHSMLMEPAVINLQDALSKVQFETPKFPIYFNVLANLENDASKFRELLLKQLTHTVRFRETLLNIPHRHFIECGPGRVLSGLVKKTLPTATITDTNTLDNIRTLILK